jgi:hypothetical protein
MCVGMWRGLDNRWAMSSQLEPCQLSSKEMICASASCVTDWTVDKTGARAVAGWIRGKSLCRVVGNGVRGVRFVCLPYRSMHGRRPVASHTWEYTFVPYHPRAVRLRPMRTAIGGQL